MSNHLGYVEPFNGKLRDKLLNGAIFYTLNKARIVIEACRRHYNTRGSHSRLDQQTLDHAYFNWLQQIAAGPNPADVPLIKLENLFKRTKPAIKTG